MAFQTRICSAGRFSDGADHQGNLNPGLVGVLGVIQVTFEEDAGRRIRPDKNPSPFGQPGQTIMSARQSDRCPARNAIMSRKV